MNNVILPISPHAEHSKMSKYVWMYEFQILNLIGYLNVRFFSLVSNLIEQIHGAMS